MEVGLVQKIDIDQEMQQSYLDYAMSVIVSRALPDARDGLKPVHRRILYAMYDMGIRPNTPYKKSARIVGEVLGKYHPHGDMAVYDAMARMAQDFSMRLQLVDGQGNFGSVDGDPPAAMRYTEARMASPAGDMLADIEKSTVDFIDNFDGTLTEPAVLPAALPNLLVNGATGIAVGMSTSIPPHNLTEVAAALQYMLEHWDKMDDIGLEDIMKFIQGPDFPTGGVIIQEAEGESLASAYASGRGRITLQARAHVEEMDRSRQRIIVTELPYMTNKSNLIERIANLAREERIEGISDLRDESDRNGMRIVIELSRNTHPDEVLRNLYKSTPMRSTFSLIMLALVDGEPRMLGLKQCLRVYLEHRQEIVRRRSEYELGKARQRVHILEGLLTALNNLDEVIDIIRRSRTVETARANLERKFKLSEIQTTAILDMPLRRLAALERKKIEEEHAELVKRIKELESLLRSPKKMRALIASELAAVTNAYEDPRRTQIVQLKEGEVKASVLRASDLAPDTTVWVTVDADGRIARTTDDKPPRPSGRDVPILMVKANTRDTLYLVAEDGETAALLLTALPEANMPSEGSFFHRMSALSSEQRLATVFSLPPKSEQPAEGWYVLTVSDQGMVKRSDLNELPGPSAGTFTLARINDGDRLLAVRFSQGESEVLLATRSGMAIRFKEEEVRPMGLVAAGVMGIKLQGNDRVVGAELLPSDDDVFFIASDGSAKRVAPNQFPQQGRYGQGVQAWKLPRKVEVVGMTIGRGTLRVTVHLKLLAAKSARLDEAPKLGRSARGSAILEMKAGDEVTGLSTPWEPPRPRGARPASPPPAAASAKTSARKPKTRGSSRSKSGSTSKKRSTRSGAKKPRAK